MPRQKNYTQTHLEIAKHLDFLRQSPAYKCQVAIIWRVGGIDYIRAAEDLSDLGLVGVEKERVGLESIVTVSAKRDLIPDIVDKVSLLVGAAA